MPDEESNPLRGATVFTLMEQNDSVEEAWQKFEKNIINAASEELGFRKFNINKQSKNKPSLTKEIKELSERQRSLPRIHKLQYNTE